MGQFVNDGVDCRLPYQYLREKFGKNGKKVARKWSKVELFNLKEADLFPDHFGKKKKKKGPRNKFFVLYNFHAFGLFPIFKRALKMAQ